MENFKSELGDINNLLYKIPLKQVMSSPVKTVFVDDDFSKVEETFINNNIHHLPVINQDRKIVGIISQKDVYRHISPRRSPDGEVFYRQDIILDKDGYYEKESLNKYITNVVMRKNPVVLTENKTVGDAVHAMVSSQISCVPIVSDKKHVIGIITRVDVLKLIDNSFKI